LANREITGPAEFGSQKCGRIQSAVGLVLHTQFEVILVLNQFRCYLKV
jgi:hypothetical protein